MAHAAVLGVVRVPIARWVEPEAVWAALSADHPHLVWSDRSGAPTDPTGFIGLPRSADDVLAFPDEAADGAADDPVERLCALLRARLPEADSAWLGWWGWLAYELGQPSHGVTGPPSDQPAAAFLLATRGVEFDHAARTVQVLALDDDREWAERTAVRLRDAVVPPLRDPPPAGATWRLDREAYLDRIARCLAAIGRGDAYQICLTNRATVRSAAPISDLDVFRRLRSRDRAAYGGLLRFGDVSLVSQSPERFLRVDAGGRATTRPIKGTAPRGADDEADRRSAAHLQASEKERAENLMIVDLMRNDLSRVSEVGSVGVQRLFDVERTATLLQLVSTVEARLRGDALSAIPALFPAGSMTGAPKRAAMQHLATMEEGPRGIYSGAWGRIACDGSLDLAVVIRSAVVRGDTATVGAGGGITALSDPSAEWEEILLKAAPLLEALGAAG